MKHLVLGLLACAPVLVPGGAGAEEPTVMTVQIRTAQLRATPSYLGKLTATVNYTDQVTVLQSQGDWRQVKSNQNAGEGWVHLSALRAKELKVKTDAQDTAATASGKEASMAGKGFNKDVEMEFRAKNTEIDFAPIDRMQGRSVSMDEMIRFLAEGAIKPAGGGA